MAADHREHSQSEGDVGGRGDCPALRGVTAHTPGEQQVQSGQDEHPAEGGGNRHCGATGIA